VRWIGLVMLAGCAGVDTALPPPPVELPPAAAAPVASAPPPCPVAEPWLPEVPVGPGEPPLVAIERPELLEAFFVKVARLARGLATDHLRIAVYGDSNLTMDHMTGRMRRTLQQRFGDAGHGFVSLGRPWAHYHHMDVQHDCEDGFDSYACSTDPVLDHGYGISGIAAESRIAGARTWVATAGAGSMIGQTASRFDVFYLRGDDYGTFDIVVDDGERIAIDSRAAERSVGIHHLELDDAPHRLDFIATDRRRRVRLLGVTLERGGPSFVVDSFGVGAMNTASQAREDPAVNHPMLERRDYDLVVFATGANDVFTLDVTPGHLAKIIARHRAAIPGVPILVLTPADRGMKRSFPQTLLAMEQRKEIARDNGTALWDLWQAMGGRGSMRAFKDRGMAMSDYVHFNEAGGGYMGDRLVYALLDAAWAYIGLHSSAGCP
jgi:lysophospholipase L1-like esterase